MKTLLYDEMFREADLYCKECGAKLETIRFDKWMLICPNQFLFHTCDCKPYEYYSSRDPEVYAAKLAEGYRYIRKTIREELERRKALNHAYRKESHQQVLQGKYRAKRLGLCDSLTDIEWEITKKHFNYECAYCGKIGRPDLMKECLTIDHVVPLSHGGGHVFGNVVPACLECNLRKHDYDVESFYENGIGKTPGFTEERYKKLTDFLQKNFVPCGTEWQDIKRRNEKIHEMLRTFVGAGAL